MYQALKPVDRLMGQKCENSSLVHTTNGTKGLFGLAYLRVSTSISFVRLFGRICENNL